MDELRAGNRRRLHFEGSNADCLRALQPLREAVDPPIVHQESDRTAVHSENRPRATFVEHRVKRLKHEAVAPERDERLGFIAWHEIITLAKKRLGRPRYFGMGRDQPHAELAQVLALRVSHECGASAFNPWLLDAVSLLKR